MFTITAKGNIIGSATLVRATALSTAGRLSTTAYRHCVVVVTDTSGTVIGKYRKGDKI